MKNGKIREKEFEKGVSSREQVSWYMQGMVEGRVRLIDNDNQQIGLGYET